MTSMSEIARLIRNLRSEVKQQVIGGRALKIAQARLEERVRAVGEDQGETLGGRTLTARDRILARTHNMQAHWFVIEYDAADEGDTVDNTSRSVDTVGFFIADRLWITWRATSGENNGRYGLISSAQAGCIDHTATNIVDFTFNLVDGASGRRLANVDLPSDMFARQDGSGFPAGSLILTGGTTVTIELTPLRAWPSDGVLSFIFEGIQSFDQVGAP